MRFLRQAWIATVIALQSIKDRIWMSLAAISAVAIVVGVLLAFQAMGTGFKKTLQQSGSDSVAVITRVGSRSEVNSVISGEQVSILLAGPGIARDELGRALASGELYVIVDGVKKTTGTQVNLPLRGIGAQGIALRDGVTITEGRMFVEGRNEIIVGEAVLREFSGFEMGTEVRINKGEWTVVGVFSSGGSAFEGELWADARVVQSQFRRAGSVQSVRIRLSETGDVEPMVNYVERDPRLEFDVVTEKEYFKDQSSGLDNLVYLGNTLAAVMALGALAGALNAMFTSVQGRTREIATLRAIGYGGAAAFTATLVESLILAMIGGVIGLVASFLLFDGISASTLGQSFTQVVFALEFTPQMMVNGFFLAFIIGLIGGVIPAWRSARVPVIKAFRI